MLRRPTFIFFLVLFMPIFGMVLNGCGGGGGSSNTISVSLSPSAAQAIDQGQKLSFTASVANDSSSKGVTWGQTGGSLSGQTSTSATFTASGSTGSGTVTATSASDSTKSAKANITITAVPSLSVPALPGATIGSSYSQKVSAAGGAGTLTYSISSGALPAGLTLSGNTISGTPTGPAGSSTFTLKVTDSSTAGAMSATQQLSISVSPLSITTTSLPNGSVGGAYSVVLTSTGGLAPVTWSVFGGTLPAGLSLNAATGAITGTPTAGGTANITFQAADSSSPQETAKATLSLTIAQLMITTTSLLNPMVGEAYNQTLLYTDSGGTLPVTWSLASGSSLPAGFSLDPSSGAITGTATSAEVGTTSFTVQLTDSSAPPQTATQALSLTITTATACGSGSESLLNGQYAMSLTGFDASGPVGLLASFTANGSGGITSGYEDINSMTGVQSNLSVVPAGSSYSLGSDRRGCLTLVTSSGTRVFRIAVGILSSTSPQVYTIGRSIEFDTSGTNVAGTIQDQQSSGFSNGAFQGGFAYTVQSPLNSAVGGGFFGSVGVLNLSGSSVTGEGDMNINGSVDPGNAGYPGTAMPFTGGTYNISGTGRGTLSFSAPVNGTPTTINLILYVLSTTQVYVMSSAPQSTTNGALNLFSGFAELQTGSPYNNASLNTACVLFSSGQTAAGGASSRVEAGIFTPDGKGNFTLSGDLNSGGTVSSVTSSGTYAVDSSGRILITNSGGAAPAIIMYMGLPGYSYSLSTDANVMLGNAEPQTGTPFTNATLSGIFSLGTIVPVVAGSPLRAGEANYDGKGNLTITFDVNEGGFLSLDNVTTATYAASANGRVVSPAGGTTLAVSYIKSTGTVISFGYTSTDTNPTLQVMDQ